MRTSSSEENQIAPGDEPQLKMDGVISDIFINSGPY